MQQKTEVLYVTPPDLYLPVAGIRLFYLGGDEEWKETVQKTVEEMFKLANITHYFVPDPVNEQNIPWVYANITHCDLVFINLDIINPVELAFAFSRCHDENTWFYSGLSKNKSILRVLNTVGKCPVFENMDSLAIALKIESGHD